jgi:hypothetical protein
MAPGSCQGIVNSIATTEILPWLQHAAVVIGGKNGAGALHTRIRPVSVGRMRGTCQWRRCRRVRGGAIPRYTAHELGV